MGMNKAVNFPFRYVTATEVPRPAVRALGNKCALPDVISGDSALSTSQKENGNQLKLFFFLSEIEKKEKILDSRATQNSPGQNAGLSFRQQKGIRASVTRRENTPRRMAKEQGTLRPEIIRYGVIMNGPRIALVTDCRDVLWRREDQ